jgi:hypothetical protein
MRRLLVVMGLLGLFTGVAGQTTTPDASPGQAACPATTEAENLALARAWREEVINRRDPAALREILAPEVVNRRRIWHADWRAKILSYNGNGESLFKADPHSSPGRGTESVHGPRSSARRSSAANARRRNASVSGGGPG